MLECFMLNVQKVEAITQSSPLEKDRDKGRNTASQQGLSVIIVNEGGTTTGANYRVCAF